MESKKTISFKKAVKSYPKTFWIANTMELFERWAFYGFFMLFANYLVGSTDEGMLGFSNNEKSIIMAVGTALLYFFPVIFGAISDRIGYKKSLAISYLIYIISLVLMPSCKSFIAVFVNYLFLAIGAGLFKPIVSATVARTTTAESAPLGFGIFYQMVNIGAFLGPFVALISNNGSYSKVFYISAVLISLNFIILIFYKEPVVKKPEESFNELLNKIFRNIWTSLKDTKFLFFLIIVAGFWTMYFQLFYTLPVFIKQWVNTIPISDKINEFAPWLISLIGSKDGTIQAEFFTNTDALFIIIFQLLISTIIMRWRALNAMIIGFTISSIGMGLTLITNNGFFILFAIFIFGIGEMVGSPKITEYIGKIAPKDKKALYMGYSFIPVFFGNIFAGLISGPLYQNWSDKTSIVKREFIERGLDIPNITQNELLAKACSDFNLSDIELNDFLWAKYSPNNIWYVIMGIGFVAALALWFYNNYVLKEKK